MNGLRTIASQARVHLRRNSNCFCLHCLRAGTFPSPALSSLSGRPNTFLVGATGDPQFRSYAHFTQTQFARKPSTYWSILAATVVGIGGAFLVLKNSNEDVLLTNSLFPSVDCASKSDNGKCEEKESCVERKCETSDCLRKTDREDELILRANAKLENALKDTKTKAIELTEEALKAFCDAIEALKIFMNKVYCACEEENLDQPRFDDVWCDVEGAQKKRCDLVQAAHEKAECAEELLRRLREIIENGKACKYTQCNRLLVTAEATLICAEKEFAQKRDLMCTLMKESRSAEQYKNIIEDFRRDVKNEADSLIASEECTVTFNENEVNMILAHAYKKIIRSQKLLKKDKRC